MISIPRSIPGYSNAFNQLHTTFHMHNCNSISQLAIVVTMKPYKPSNGINQILPDNLISASSSTSVCDSLVEAER